MQKPLFNQAFLLKMMKISLTQCVLSFAFVFQIFANEGKAQDLLEKNVSVNLQNVSMQDALFEIGKVADAKFFYSSKIIQSERKISLQAQNLKFSEVLSRLFSPMNISYKVYGNQIVLNTLVEQTAAEKSTVSYNENPTAPMADPITGKITAANGEVMPGVNVVVKGTKRGVSTDAEGNFKINADKGETLQFSFLGYKTKDVVVGESNTINVALIEDAGSLDEVVVVGSRAETARTNVERPVPVDVLSAKELRSTGQVELGQQVQFMSPSFNSTKNGINGIANYADPASLKGLSPDQMLVMIDGKRYHQFAAVQNNVTVGKGTVVTDLSSIPSLALERIEILRDGAAAQYGSDAIAGIANLVLKKSVNKGSAQIQYGATSKGDGGGYTAGVNYGFALGKKGSLNITGSWQDVKGTDRSDPYNPQPVAGGAYAGIYTNVAATDQALLKSRGVWGDGTYGSFHVGQYGSNAMKSGQVFYNLDLPMSKGWTMYSNGGYSNKKVFAQAFLRTAVPASATSDPEIYPDGYVPQLPGISVDYTWVVGLKRKVLGGWNLDFSTGYGKNYLDQNANNSVNPSYGATSPTSFYAGRIGFGQSLTEANFSKTKLGFAGTKSTNFAFGGQYRVDNFQLTPGDDLASPSGVGVGPLTTTKNKTPGSQGRVGIDAADKTNKSRSNLGIYADVESDITNRFLVAAALRYENYSDFGSNVSGKLASRIKLTEGFSIRGSINKGFRAPLLQQIANAATTSTVQSGIITSTKQFPSSDPRLAQVGIEDPKPETSWNYNLGVTAQAGKNFLFTLDAYQIDISNRIIITENLAVASIAALKPLFTGFKEITFFTNAISTKTQGIDLVASYKQAISPKSKLTASIALTVNKTRISAVKATPSLLQAGTEKPVVLIDTISRALIETSQPHTKVLISVGYQIGKFGINVRSTYFGAVTGWEKLSKPVAGTSNLHQSQTFAGKNLFDVSVNYNINKYLTLTAGGNNITNVYPDKVFANYASYTNGQVPYTRNANQFGFNGAYYYGSILVNF
jgi:iron complex outermembrane recepter protein